MAPTTLPSSWFRSEAFYQFERRAVFLKAWHVLGPITRFQTPGEKIPYEVGQVKFYVQSGEPDGKGLQVVVEDDMAQPKGKVLRHHLTPNGLLFGTISDDAPSFEGYFPDLMPVLNTVNFLKLPYRHSVRYTGKFNWKTMIDGYQECLHCKYTHPVFFRSYPTEFYAVHPHTNFTQHIADPNKPKDGLFLYFFPIYSIGVYGGGMNIMRACPTEDPKVTRMEFDYYHTGTEEEFQAYFNFVRQVAKEDFDLCESAQQNLERGVYVEGVLNSNKELGVSFYQALVRTAVTQQAIAEGITT